MKRMDIKEQILKSKSIVIGRQSHGDWRSKSLRLEGKVIEIGNREKCAVKLKKTIKKVWDRLKISLSLKLIITLSRKIQLTSLLRQ